MGLKLGRRKPRNFLLTAVYRVSRLLGVLPARTRLRFYLDLEWIFDRLALEDSFLVFAPEEHPFRRFPLAFLLRQIGSSDRVLDLGSNRGDMSALLACHCREVIGIEVESQFVEEALRRHRIPNLRFIHGDGRDYLQREATRFDVILLSHVIEHLDDPGDLLELAARSSRLVYVEVPDFDRSYLNQYRTACGSSLVFTDDDHVWEFDRDELRALIEKSGLEIVEEDFRFGVIRVWCRARA